MAKYPTTQRGTPKVMSFTPQRGSKSQNRCPHRPTHSNHSDKTARIAGKDLGEMTHVWKEVAASEVKVSRTKTWVLMK